MNISKNDLKKYALPVKSHDTPTKIPRAMDSTPRITQANCEVEMKRYWREFLKIPYFFNVNKFFSELKKRNPVQIRTYHNNTGKTG
jgi:hypothetical protein